VGTRWRGTAAAAAALVALLLAEVEEPGNEAEHDHCRDGHGDADRRGG
jgi:hypothetical protein